MIPAEHIEEMIKNSWIADADKVELDAFFKWLEKCPVVYKGINAEEKDNLIELHYKFKILKED
jgi:hypothetical protein|tara:strand:- start:550 stop:738 length:189 start_codon:yes stop_codon:yes gene_type:complete